MGNCPDCMQVNNITNTGDNVQPRRAKIPTVQFGHPECSWRKDQLLFFTPDEVLEMKIISDTTTSTTFNVKMNVVPNGNGQLEPNGFKSVRQLRGHPSMEHIHLESEVTPGGNMKVLKCTMVYPMIGVQRQERPSARGRQRQRRQFDLIQIQGTMVRELDQKSFQFYDRKSGKTFTISIIKHAHIDHRSSSRERRRQAHQASCCEPGAHFSDDQTPYGLMGGFHLPNTCKTPRGTSDYQEEGAATTTGSTDPPAVEPSAPPLPSTPERGLPHQVEENSQSDGPPAGASRVHFKTRRLLAKDRHDDRAHLRSA